MNDDVLNDLNGYPGSVIQQIGTIPPAVSAELLCDLVNDAFDNGGWDLMQKLSIDQIYLFGLFLSSMTAPQLNLPLIELAQTGLSITTLFRDLTQGTIRMLSEAKIAEPEQIRKKGVIVRLPNSKDLVFTPTAVEGLPEGVQATRITLRENAELNVILPAEEQAPDTNDKDDSNKTQEQ